MAESEPVWQTVVGERTAAAFERREIKVVFNYRWQDTDVIRLDSGHKVLQLWLRFERHALGEWQLAKAWPVTLEMGSGELGYWTGVGLAHDPETVPGWVRALIEEHRAVDTHTVTRTEWGVQYENPDALTMTGRPHVRVMPVHSEEIAREAVAWDHSPWDRKRNRRVVRREVTEWEQG